MSKEIKELVAAHQTLQEIAFATAERVNEARRDSDINRCLDFDIDIEGDEVSVRYEYTGYSGDYWGDDTEDYCTFPISYLWDDDVIEDIRRTELAENIMAVAKKQKEDKEKEEWATECRRRDYFKLKKEFG